MAQTVKSLIATLQAIPNHDADVVIDAAAIANDQVITSVTDECLPATPASDGPESSNLTPDAGQVVLVC